MEKKQEVCFFFLIFYFCEAKNFERIKAQGREGNVAAGGLAKLLTYLFIIKIMIWLKDKFI